MGVGPTLSQWEMPSVVLDLLLSLVSLSATFILFRLQYPSTIKKRARCDDDEHKGSQANSSTLSATPTSAYLLPSYIHHARMLPKESRHMFRYPTLYLAIPLSQLENGACDVGWGGRLFRWNEGSSNKGRRRKAALTALEASDYLGAGQEMSWLTKLEGELTSRGFLHTAALVGERSEFEVWATTMPSLMGVHGINPLTVYYIYRKDINGPRQGSFYICVLEVHNTFSERHIYILPAGLGEDQEADSSVSSPDDGISSESKGEGLSWQVDRRRGEYDHQWTFPRSFHVSPFNDRGGYYRLYLKSLWQEGSSSPTMDVRLLLLVPDEAARTSTGQPILHKKILATLNSYPHICSKAPLRLTGSNLLACLARQPFDLLLTFVRIAYQAAKLHYGRKLSVFGKPDMSVAASHGFSVSSPVEERRDFNGEGWPMPSNATQVERLSGPISSSLGIEGDSVKVPKNGAILWPAPSFLDVVAKERFLALAKQSPAISVRLVMSDGTVETILSKEAAAAGTSFCETETSTTTSTTTSSSSNIVKEEASSSSSSTSKERQRQQLLTIYLLSPAFFSDILLYPSPPLALLLGSRVGRRWGVNSVPLFTQFFLDLENSAREQMDLLPEGGKEKMSLRRRSERLARLRRRHYRWASSFASSSSSSSTRRRTDPNPTSTSHPLLLSKISQAYTNLDSLPSTTSPSHPLLPLLLLSTLFLLHLSSTLGEKIFRWIGARYQVGSEPWLEWKRGEELLFCDDGREVGRESRRVLSQEEEEGGGKKMQGKESDAEDEEERTS